MLLQPESKGNGMREVLNAGSLPCMFIACHRILPISVRIRRWLACSYLLRCATMQSEECEEVDKTRKNLPAPED